MRPTPCPVAGSRARCPALRRQPRYAYGGSGQKVLVAIGRPYARRTLPQDAVDEPGAVAAPDVELLDPGSDQPSLGPQVRASVLVPLRVDHPHAARRHDDVVED